MRSIPPNHFALTLAALLGLSNAQAQDIEPRAYANAPVGVNFLIAGYANTDGGLAFDSALPVKNPELETHNALFAYAHVLDLWGKSAKFDVIAPFTWLSGTAVSSEGKLTRDVDGLSDTRLRLSVNFYGAPALSLQDYASYQQDLIIGASLQVSAPTSQYDANRLVNIGTNRWSFKPEFGVSKSWRPWTLELAAGATVYTDNNDFYGGNRREQDPLYSLQGHAVYTFRSDLWGSLDATYYTGGRTTLNGTYNSDLQQNWRTGFTLAYSVNTHQSIKFNASNGVSSRTGNDYDMFGIAWQYRWGGGL